MRLFNRKPRPAAPQPPPATWVPPGHFYSPIVNVAELEGRRGRIGAEAGAIDGIDFRESEQLALAGEFAGLARRLPFTPGASPPLRYFYENDMFSYGDGTVLACMLMHHRPSRIVEVGSGYSSALMLDVNDLFLGGRTACTFVEPYPERLNMLLQEQDRQRVRIVESAVQELDLAVIDELGAGDVLFIDSTHVCKTGGDVNHHLFTILPRLKAGVIIHFHDVFYPFEYPEGWIFRDNRSWNEVYVLRAFLTNNAKYEMLFFNHFLFLKHGAVMGRLLPLFCKNPGGSLWLRKR